LGRFFGGYLVHYGPSADSPPPSAPPGAAQRAPRGAVAWRVEIVCEEQAWPLSEHAAEVVVLQHGLDFCLSPHGLLREAASSVRPGGHLLIVGINPWSALGVCVMYSRATRMRQGALYLSRRGLPTGSTCWASRWRNAASGAIVRRSRQPQVAGPGWPGWDALGDGDWQLPGRRLLSAGGAQAGGRAAAAAPGAPRADGQADPAADGQGQSTPYRSQ
jgi:hypothetical protein